MISRSQMNRQLYQMGGEGMQAGMQEGMQEGIMQMAPQEMQQMDAEQYRPVAEQLAQDPNQALMAIVKMLMEQGIPEEEAIKIAKQMIQAVAEGGIEEISDDTRVEARFGGRIGYAGGGISNVAIARETLQSRAPEGEFLAYINPEEAGILKALGGAGKDINATGVPSFFVKKIFKAAKSVVKGAAKAVKSVAKSPIGRIALTIAAGYYLGPMVSGFSSNPFVQGALRGGLANLAVQAASGQKINFGEALTSAALGGVTQGFTQGQTGGFDGTEGVFNTSTSGGLENLTMPTASSGFPQNAPIFGMDNIPVDSAAPAASASFTSPLTSTASDFDYSGLSSDFDSNVFTDARPGVKSLGPFGTAEASTTFPQGDMVTTPTGFNSEYSRFGSGDPAQFGFGKDAIDISNTPPVYKQTSFGKTIGEVETPLSQRYDTFTSALGEGNYLDALKQVSGVALDYPLTTIGGISTLASAMAPEIPEQLPGESMEEYRARVAEFERQYASNLSGRTGPSLPASARNPFYPVYAARGGRIGYLFGGSGVASAVAQPVEGQSMPVSDVGGKGIGGMLRNLIANNPEIFRQVTSEQTTSPMQRSSGPIPLGLVDYSGTPYENAIKKKSVAQPTIGGSTYSSGGGFGGLNMGSDLIKQITQQSFFNTNEDEEDTRYKLPASARNPFYGVMMANGGRMRYAMGNSVQDGIMAAPQIASQMGMPVGNPRMNEGGVPELDYRDEGGFVPPIGIKERADDIPAMLSNNEFVFTADAVKNAGGGDPNVGAQKMYTLMKRLESGGRV
jgi:hypothetical protein